MDNKKLYRVEKGKKICGVCLGIANYLNVDVTMVRIIWAAVTFFTSIIPGILLYIICAFIMPEYDGTPNGPIDGEFKEL
ncbi:PspC domain-containing protein [Lachnospiraceae bacterium NSJ-143]|nr:PspC domain-containing protein [Lachnospiraceae bacterium NSJ-143]